MARLRSIHQTVNSLRCVVKWDSIILWRRSLRDHDLILTTLEGRQLHLELLSRRLTRWHCSTLALLLRLILLWSTNLLYNELRFDWLCSLQMASACIIYGWLLLWKGWLIHLRKFRCRNLSERLFQPMLLFSVLRNCTHAYHIWTFGLLDKCVSVSRTVPLNHGCVVAILRDCEAGHRCEVRVAKVRGEDVLLGAGQV